jgi:hypothetical protein
MKNVKHLQGICNNLIMSLTEHPENYFRFWSHLYKPTIDFGLKLNLLVDNNYPDYLTGDACSDIQATIFEYRGFFNSQLEKHKIDCNDIQDATIEIKTDIVREKVKIFEAKFIVRTKDGQKFEAMTLPSFWGNEADDIEEFSNGVKKKAVKR